MITNLKVQIIFRSVLVILAFIGIYNILSKDVDEFFFKYTYLSNAVCFIFMSIVLGFSIYRYRKGERKGNNEFFPLFKFAATVMIMVTFLIYATMLESMFSASYWQDGQNLIIHFFVPLMFFIDWVLFDKHKTIGLSDIPYALIIPNVYVIYIMIRARFVTNFDNRYPYDFLNIDEHGTKAVLITIILLLVAFYILGMLMWVYDKLIKVDGKLKFSFKKESE